MDKLETCPTCNGSGLVEIIRREKEVEFCHYDKKYNVQCWRCNGVGAIPKVDVLRGLLFEAMIQDSINLRQKLLWSEVESDILEAGEKQIKCFEEAIEAKAEEDYIIEEYKGHLERFKEWFQIFKMDLQLIVALRNGFGSFTDKDCNYIDTNYWIVRNEK